MTHKFTVDLPRIKFDFEISNGEVWLIELIKGLPIKTSLGQNNEFINNIEDAKSIAIQILYTSKRINKTEFKLLISK